MNQKATAPQTPRGETDLRDRTVRVPQQARSRQTRERIVAVAMECYEQFGYDETTTALIAKRAGVAVGTLYGYFKNKRDILLEVVDYTLVEVGDLVARELEPSAWQGRDARDVVRSLIDTIFHIQTLRPGTQRVVWERYFKDEAFRQVVEALHRRTRGDIDRFLDAVQASGELRDIDRGTASWVIHNAVQWNASQAFLSFRDDANRVDLAARAVADLISRYLFRDVDETA